MAQQELLTEEQGRAPVYFCQDCQAFLSSPDACGDGDAGDCQAVVWKEDWK